MFLLYFVETPASNGDALLHVGLGGAVAVFILREVFKFLKDRREEGEEAPAGLRSVDFWRAEIKEAIGSAMSEQLGPILEQQTKILDKIADTQREEVNLLTKLATLAESQERYITAKAAAMSAKS